MTISFNFRTPENTSPELKDMLQRLLTRDAAKRIGISKYITMMWLCDWFYKKIVSNKKNKIQREENESHKEKAKSLFPVFVFIFLSFFLSFFSPVSRLLLSVVVMWKKRSKHY